MAIAAGTTCSSCGGWIASGAVHTCMITPISTTPWYPPTPPSTSMPYSMSTVAGDINWRIYSAACPPADGTYFIVVVDTMTGYRDWMQSSYTRSTFTWSAISGSSNKVVTHYAQVELPT